MKFIFVCTGCLGERSYLALTMEFMVNEFNSREKQYSLENDFHLAN